MMLHFFPVKFVKTLYFTGFPVISHVITDVLTSKYLFVIYSVKLQEYSIFFGASWCGNTQAIVGQVARKARANGKVVYVYDTTIGNQISFGSGENADTITGSSSSFNSRTSASSNGNNNISYLYGELVKYLGDFITENNSKKNNQINYYPNGDINGEITSVKPWEEADAGTVKSAIRLQLPFLIGYNKDAAKPVTKQWIHKNAANDGTYTEYMLTLAQVLDPDSYQTGNKDGLTNGEFAREGVNALSDVLGNNDLDYKPIYEDCDGDGYDDATGKKLPWYRFDATQGDVIPEDWNGITIYNSEADYQKAHQATAQEAAAADYIADSYNGVQSGHVFESVTQERLLDILSSEGNYYILFGGPEHATSQAALASINEQAKADGITKIYHFDPVIDGYQIDITDENTRFKAMQGKSVYELWTRITALLPTADAITNYESSDTLLFAFSNDGKTKEIKASYSLKDAKGFDKTAAKSEVAKVFRAGEADGAVVKSDVRTDYEFFKRVYNGAATYFNAVQSEGEATENRTGKAEEIFKDTDEEGFALHQVNYNELVNLLQSDSGEEYYIFFGASWCHNTQAIIGSVERKAKANDKKVYVYDTTVGNQLTFDENDVNTVTGISSAFNSRNNASTPDGNSNISYLYGELVKYLGDFTTENNSKRNNSIAYFPNGDLSGEVTSVKPWEDAEEGTVKNAIRLQMPFLIAYAKDAEQPVTKQWLHKDAADNGEYTEYMLELAWVLNTPEAAASTETIDGLSYVEFAAEAVKELSTVLGDKEPAGSTTPSDPNKTPGTSTGGDKTPGTTTGGDKTPTPTPQPNVKVQAPKKAKISKITPKKKSAKKVKIKIKKISGVGGYQVQISKNKKKFTKKNILAKKFTTKNTITITAKKLKNKKKLYVRVRAYNLDGTKKVYGEWSTAKQVKIKK